jgi:hypothetical protein
MSLKASTIPANEGPDWLNLVREKVESLQYGVVQVVVHDRKVTQIERTDKTRLDSLTQDPALRRR